MSSRRWNANRGYMKFEVWQNAQELVSLVAEILNGIELNSFRLRDQILDATHSAPSNISEGYCRKSINEYIQFCYVALGSLGELMSRMTSLVGSRILTEELFESFDVKHFQVENKLIALVKSLEAKRDSGTWEQAFRT